VDEGRAAGVQGRVAALAAATVAAAGALLALSVASGARADASNAGDCERPWSEISTWLSIGGGARVGPDRRVTGIGTGGFGYDWTFPIAADGDFRAGLWAGIDSPAYHALAPAGGAELVFAAVPSELDLFSYDSEGVLSLRAGAGVGIPGGSQDLDGPFVTGTIAWGYRAPWDRWDRWRCGSLEESGERRAAQRYMIGVRFFVTATVGVRDNGWSATGGIEFEPVGAFRYFLGIR